MDFSILIPDKFILGSYKFEKHTDVIICVAPRNEVPCAPIADHNFPISLLQSDEVSLQNLLLAVEKCIEYLKQNKSVYLHCILGHNRSATVAVLVIEKFFNISRIEAIEYVSARRHIYIKKHMALL